MKKNLLILPLSLLLLASCSNDISSNSSITTPSSNPSTVTTSSSSSSSSSDEQLTKKMSLLTPAGSPALSYASFVGDDNYEISVEKTITNIPASFIKGDKDFIIFDFYNAANVIKKNNANYKLAATITGGNAYLIGTRNKDVNDTISDDDYIVSFGNNSSFTKIFEKVHSVTVDAQVGSVSEALPVAKSGKLNGQNVDYVVLAEPVVTTLFSSKTDTDKFFLKENINDSWKTYSIAQNMNGGKGFTSFPQAGLFVKADYESGAYTSQVKSILEKINTTSKDVATNNGEETFKVLDQKINDKVIDEAFFGFPYASFKKTVNSQTNPNNTTNALGYMYDGFDVNGFLTEANLDGYSPLDEAVFSTYYVK